MNTVTGFHARYTTLLHTSFRRGGCGGRGTIPFVGRAQARLTTNHNRSGPLLFPSDGKGFEIAHYPNQPTTDTNCFWGGGGKIPTTPNRPDPPSPGFPPSDRPTDKKFLYFCTVRHAINGPIRCNWVFHGTDCSFVAASSGMRGGWKTAHTGTATVWHY